MSSQNIAYYLQNISPHIEPEILIRLLPHLEEEKLMSIVILQSDLDLRVQALRMLRPKTRNLIIGAIKRLGDHDPEFIEILEATFEPTS